MARNTEAEGGGSDAEDHAEMPNFSGRAPPRIHRFSGLDDLGFRCPPDPDARPLRPHNGCVQSLPARGAHDRRMAPTQYMGPALVLDVREKGRTRPRSLGRIWK